MPSLTIGVLALQGAFAKHLACLSSLRVHSIAVRKAEDLHHCDGLIIPGGESTAIAKQLTFIGLWETIKDFSKTKPILGTCAGIILMAKEISEKTPFIPLGLFNICVARNAYGRQKDSFSFDLNFQLPMKEPAQLKAIFIRAPRIESWAPEIKVLASLNDKPVLIQQGLHIGACFHPELTDNYEIHKHFVGLTGNINLQKTG
jgi:pyridoxal 5'-phosphate synthase pdxT subunit